VPATGFSIGFERVILILAERAGAAARGRRRVALLFDEATPDLKPVLERARQLREQEELAVSLEFRARRRGPQLAALETQGFDGFVEGPDGPLQWFGEKR